MTFDLGRRLNSEEDYIPVPWWKEELLPDDDEYVGATDPKFSWRRTSKCFRERFKDSFSLEICGKKVVVQQGGNVDRLGLAVWDAALVLIKYLEKACGHGEEADVTGKTVLEFGSGTGLVGICASVMGARVTVLTDLGDDVLLRTLQANASANSTLRNNQGTMAVVKHEWGSDPAPLFSALTSCSLREPLVTPSFDAVLASDLVYAEDTHLDALITSLVAVCSPRTTVFFAYENHNPESVDYFLHKAGSCFNIQFVPFENMHEVYRSQNINIAIMRNRACSL